MSAKPVTARKSSTQSAAAFAIWNEPDVLDSIANSLFAAAFLLFAYGALHFMVRLPPFALREVDIKNPPAHVTLAEIETVVKRGFKGNFFTLDLNSARAEFAALPWVRSANARRVWPDRLEVELEEHVPLARWGSDALVNTQGEIFKARYNATPVDARDGFNLPDGSDAAPIAGVASASGVTSPEGAPVPPSDGAAASREQGFRLRDGNAGESGAAPSAGVASVSGVTSPKGAPVPPSDGALASREQGSRLRNANGRESGTAPIAGVASAFGVTSPKGAPVPPSDGALPLFLGPASSAKEMAIQYRYFQRSLATIGRVPVQVQVSPRRAWQLRLDNGLTIELGRERIESRLDGFIAAFDRTVGRLQRRLDYVDLRYSNGFAVRIPELKLQPGQPQRSARETKRG